MSTLPNGIHRIVSARFVASGTAYGSLLTLGTNRLEHVAFGDLSLASLSAAPSIPLGPFFSGPLPTNGSQFELDLDLTAPLSEDYAQGSSTSQYRLAFSKVAADKSWDDIELPTTSVSVSTTYLVP